MSSQFDLLAASLRADAVDLEAFVEGLAAKLTQSFPSRVRVERKGGRLRGKPTVRRLAVELAGNEYQLESEGGGQIACQRKVMVRGIALRSEQLPLEAWIDALAADLAGEAEKTESDRLALERMLEA